MEGKTCGKLTFWPNQYNCSWKPLPCEKDVSPSPVSRKISMVLGLPRLHSDKRICLPMQEMQETRVWYLGQEGPLEEGMATHSSEYSCVSCSVVYDSLRPHGLQPTRLLCPWDFPGKNTGVGCHFLLHQLKVLLASISLSKWLDKW